MKVSIIIPVYNESKTIERIINKVLEQKKIDKEIIVVDDGSTDGTKDIISQRLENKIDFLLVHKFNQGKGSAIHTGLKKVSGDIVLIQDADLEYDPSDYQNLLQPIIEGNNSVVYGSRVLGKKRYSFNGFTSTFRVFANHILTIASNIINSQKLTDAHTCYKVFKTDLITKIELNEKGFNFCPEITTKLSNNNVKIIEVPIKYIGREYNEGKKIKFKDGIEALITLIKYKIKK